MSCEARKYLANRAYAASRDYYELWLDCLNSRWTLLLSKCMFISSIMYHATVPKQESHRLPQGDHKNLYSHESGWPQVVSDQDLNPALRLPPNARATRDPEKRLNTRLREMDSPSRWRSGMLSLNGRYSHSRWRVILARGMIGVVVCRYVTRVLTTMLVGRGLAHAGWYTRRSPNTASSSRERWHFVRTRSTKINRCYVIIQRRR